MRTRPTKSFFCLGRGDVLPHHPFGGECTRGQVEGMAPGPAQVAPDGLLRFGLLVWRGVACLTRATRWTGRPAPPLPREGSVSTSPEAPRTKSRGALRLGFVPKLCIAQRRACLRLGCVGPRLGNAARHEQASPDQFPSAGLPIPCRQGYRVATTPRLVRKRATTIPETGETRGPDPPQAGLSSARRPRR